MTENENHLTSTQKLTLEIEALLAPHGYDLVQLEAIEGQPPHSAHMDVTLADGEVLHADTDIVIGHPDNPMSWDDLKVKFDGLVVPVIGVTKAASLFETARAFESGAIKKISALLAA